MGKKLFIGGFAVFVALFMLLGSSGLAQAAPIVHCGRLYDSDPNDKIDETKPCTICDILVLGKNIIDFALEIAVPVAAILFLWAGFLILLSGARPSWISKGKDVFRYTVIGLFIMFGSWLVANTVIKSLANGEVTFTDWSKIQCQETVRTGAGGIGGGGTTSDLCRNPQAMAREFNTYYGPGFQNAPELTSLIDCISREISSQVEAGMLGNIATYDAQNNFCNYSRGRESCGGRECIHSLDSCHYGGARGSQGALAVDFSNEDIGDLIIGVALNKCSAKVAWCETSGTRSLPSRQVPCSDPAATHVHVSTRSCSGN